MIRQLLSLLLIALHISVFAQTKKKTPAKLYFSKSTLTDSTALKTAMPAFGKQLLAVYRERDRVTYLDNAFRFHFLSGDYKRSLVQIDSIRMLSANKSLGIVYRAYATAKIQEPTDVKGFQKAFRKTFSDDLNASTNKTYVNNIFSDENFNRNQTNWNQLVTRLTKEKTDSVTYADAVSLSRFYTSLYNNKMRSTVLPMLSAPAFRKELENEDNRQYPVVKSVRWSNAVPIANVDEVPDPTLTYKLLMDLSSFSSDDEDTTAAREINAGLGAISRVLNLHVAGGVPKKNIDVVIVIHASGIFPFLTNDKYRGKYGIDNPNLKTIKELTDFGAKVIACGQTMYYQNIRKEDLIPGVKVSSTAQTALTTYQLKNYVLYDLE